MAVFAGKVRNTGSVRLELIDAAGSVLVDFTVANLIVVAGLKWIAERMTGSPAAMSHMALGSNGTAPNSGDIGLGAEIGRTALAASTAGAVTTYTATFPPGLATGALAELGIFNAAGGGVMLCRTAFPAQTKNAADTARVTWTITQSA